MTETHGLRHWLFGNLGYDALPFYSALAAVAAAMVVLVAPTVAGLITRYGKWRCLWSDWLTSLDRRRIGIMYVVLAMVMLSRARIEAVLLRPQQAEAVDASGFLEPEHFAQLFSTHGTIMIFFVAMPLLTGLINYVVPLQIGARDVAFSLLNSISLWLTGAGAALVMTALVVGKFSTGGWTGYPPFWGIEFSPGAGPGYWIWAVSLSSIGTTMTGINFAVTIYKNRALVMHLFRMPLFCRTALCTSILMIFAMPLLTVATAMLALRHRDQNRVGAGDPWDGRGLEWSVAAPPPACNFAVVPAVGGRDAFGQSKARAQAYLPAARYADIELPKNSATVAVIGIAGAACGFGLIRHIWRLAISGLVAMWGAVIARSFARNTHQVIHADEVRRMHTGWLKRVGMCVAISRELETTSSNQGLARAGP